MRNVCVEWCFGGTGELLSGYLQRSRRNSAELDELVYAARHLSGMLLKQSSEQGSEATRVHMQTKSSQINDNIQTN